MRTENRNVISLTTVCCTFKTVEQKLISYSEYNRYCTVFIKKH